MIAPPNQVVGRRTVAMLIDLVVWSAIAFGLFLAFAERTTSNVQLSTPFGGTASTGTVYSVNGAGALLLPALMLTIGLLYWVLPTASAGATLGKLLTGIRVVGPDLSPRVGFRRALLRQFLWIADGFPYFIPCLTGFVVAMSRPDRRRVGDVMADTTVVRRTSLPGQCATPA